MTRTVVFAQRHMVHFRVPFYEKLRHVLAEHGVQVRVLVGEPTAQEVAKSDGGTLTWGEHRRTRYSFAGSLCWMPINVDPGDGGLLVLAQENRLVLNHWELLRPRKYRVAFWGHGRNMQSNAPAGLRERFKHWTTRHADWYFAYTAASYQTLRDIGYPAQRITVVNNAVDTRQIIADRESIAPLEMHRLRQSLGLDGKRVGMFLGSLYAQKGLDFSLEAARIIRRSMPDFHWIVMGNGPDRAKVEAMAHDNSWVHCVGPRLGRDKALYASLCDVLMIPSAIGLVALDSFALGRPIVATHGGNHGPEIAYLEDGADCVMTHRSVQAYADAVIELLTQRERLNDMQRRCLLKASIYSIDGMVDNMRRGVLAALNA